MLDKGLTQAEIARQLGKSPSAIAHHMRRLGVPPDRRFSVRHDWAAVQRYYDEGHSIRECMARFGFAKRTWSDARERGDIVPRPQKMTIEELLSGAPRNRTHVRLRLISSGVKPARCEDCGLEEWRGRPVPLQLHHVNGDGADNRLSNLRLLCANCHALTDNWSGRGKRPTAGGGRTGEAA